MSEEIEVWKDVVGYEGLYQVSSLGRVKSLRFGKEKILKTTVGSVGYPLVGLRKDLKAKLFTVHYLVAESFMGHKPHGHKIVVDHIDNNKLNNRIDNLQLISQRKNNSKDKEKKSSKYTGVCRKFGLKKWEVSIKFGLRSIHLGYFEIEIDAANAYQKALQEIEQGLDLNVLYPKGRNETSKYLGISWCNKRKKWRVYYKNKHIGYFYTELEAYEAREKYILQT